MVKKLVVVGNGMAAGHLLEALHERAPGRHDITVFGAEPRTNYDRIGLSGVLSGERHYADLVIHDRAWYAARGITLFTGTPIVAIERAAARVVAADGRTAPFDTLVLATGSTPLVPDLPGAHLPGVLTYRDLDDVQAMIAAARPGARAVVIGGGLLGLEAAAGLAARGMQVTVVHLAATLMERQLDTAAGFLLAQALAARGIEVVTEAETRAIRGAAWVSGVELADGRHFPAELVVIAIGIRPATALAAQAGLDVGRGIIVDDHLRTSDAAIHALGECVEHRDVCYGLVAPLYEMARVLAACLAGDAARYTGSVTATRLKVTGIEVYSAGDFADGEGREEIVLRDAARASYRRLTLANDRIVGVVLFGDTRDGQWYAQMLREARDVSALRDTLILGQHHSGPRAPAARAVLAGLGDDAEICGCNGVCKGTIIAAIRQLGVRSVHEVRAHTKASSSCGSCTGLVEQLLALELGSAYQVDAASPLCRCTRLGHDEVRRLILARALKSIPAVMQALEWSTSCGCAKCRPALNYYLLAAWPGEYVDDLQSRFINERVHANIQKDGRFSVVPRMWGGMTSPAELRAIADVAERFAIPAVKLTGGQRIDLLGVRKEDLPAVWAELNAAGMVSGHAYGKALRTVKTCVGAEWCRFGTQDSTALGVRLEKYLWGAWTPHKVKLAVSGCPRNCAEATCKDFGVVCVDSGYELHFAGAAGIHVKATEMLCKVATEDEVVAYCAATLQLYREQGHYLERMYGWAERVGVETIRALVVDQAARRAGLVQRFERAQRYAQYDPWAARAHGREHAEFRPLVRVLRPTVSA